MGQVFAVPQPLSASVNKSAEVLSKKLECDENCEREKKLKKLKDKLDDKKDNLKTAPLQVHDARREYMQYKFGIVGYISRRKSELQKEGKAAEEKIVSDWNKKRNDAVIAVKNYRELLNSLLNLELFHKRLLASNLALHKRYQAKQNDVVTDDRVAYYEQQGTETLEYIHYIMKWIYVIAVFTFLFAALTIKNDKYKLIHIFVIMLALIIYPFSVEYIVLSIFALIRKGLEYFPSNIYTSDQEQHAQIRKRTRNFNQLKFPTYIFLQRLTWEN